MIELYFGLVYLLAVKAVFFIHVYEFSNALSENTEYL